MASKMANKFKVNDVVIGVKRDRKNSLGYVLTKCKIIYLDTPFENVETYNTVLLNGFVGCKVMAMLDNGRFVHFARSDDIIHLFDNNESLISFLNKAKNIEMRIATEELDIQKQVIKRLNDFDAEKEIELLIKE